MPPLTGDLETLVCETVADVLVDLVASDDPRPDVVPEEDVEDDTALPIITFAYLGDRELGPGDTERLADVRIGVYAEGDGARRAAAELVARIRTACDYPAFAARGLEAMVVGGTRQQTTLEFDPEEERRLVGRLYTFTMQATAP